MLKSLIRSQELAQSGVLHAPNSFLLASADELLEVCNGCGAANSWFRPPSTIYGTDIEAACHIHDWSYQKGKTIEDKDEADRVMLNNMIRLIARDRHKWYKPTRLQLLRAHLYYRSVCRFGGPAFWANKPDGAMPV